MGSQVSTQKLNPSIKTNTQTINMNSMSKPKKSIAYYLKNGCLSEHDIIEKINNGSPLGEYKIKIKSEFNKEVEFSLLDVAISKNMEQLSIKLLEKFSKKCWLNSSKKDETTLILATEKGMDKLITKMIDVYGSRCKPEYCINSGHGTALQYALRNKHIDIASVLLDKFEIKCKIDNVNKYGLVALDYAIIAGSDDIINKLLHIYDTIENPKISDKTAALAIGHLIDQDLIVRLANKLEKSFANYHPFKYKFKLGIYSRKDELDNVPYTDTLLVYCLKNKLTKIAHLLLDQYDSNCNLDSALSIALEKGYMDIAEKLIPLYQKMEYYSRNPGDNLLFLAIKQKIDEPIIIKLIDIFGDKCNPEYIEDIRKYSSDPIGITLLMYAIEYDMDNLVDKMVDLYGDQCNIEYENKRGQTVLMLAIDKNKENIAEKLLDKFNYKCRLYTEDNCKMTALKLAQFHNMQHVETTIKNILDKI